MKPPIAKKIPHQTNVHNISLDDDYYWLREKENPEVIAYLEEENDYTKERTKHTLELQDQLYDEMVGRINETDLTVPVKKGDYYYYSRTEQGKNYSIYCRKFQTLDAEEEVLLDGNKQAEGKEYFRIGAFKVSEDHKTLAYAFDDDGSEEYDVYFKNLETGEVSNESIKKTAGYLVWANDNKTIFYSTLDETRRPYRLKRYTLGQPGSDTTVFEEPDKAYFLYPYKSKSKDYIFIQLSSKVTTEVHLLNASEPNGNFTLFAPRQQNEEYSVVHHKDSFFILTNDKALNFKIMQTPVGDTNRQSWTEFIPHNESALLSALEVFDSHLVVYGRKEGYKSIEVFNLITGEKHDVDFPEPVYTYWQGNSPEFEASKIRFTYSSLITPRTVFDYDLDTRNFDLLKEYEVVGGYDKDDYDTIRLIAPAEDGTSIPISLAYKKGMGELKDRPGYLYGYGSYGASMDPYFSTIRLSLLDRGFVFAIAHVRGGSEMGRKWYEDGKFLNKKNTFTDFIDCAKYLGQEAYIDKNRLVISGGSAGGLLMGAVMNLAPDLFKVAVAHVPFVDVINTMLDDTIPLTVIEYEEWGNPNDIDYFNYMISYSPYDNVKPVSYPNLLITAGLNDPRVQYWEPAKWTAKLRQLKKGENELLLKTNMGAGHGGASGRYEAIKEYAFEYAFILDKV